MNLLNVLKISGSALTAQRLRMDVVSSNIANVETTRTPDGGPYRRQQVVFRPVAMAVDDTTSRTGNTQPESMAAQGVQVSQIVANSDKGRVVFDPRHPDADADGFVTYPEIDVLVEMTDMLSASRAYEANVTVLNTIKAMAQRTLDIGR